jgi:adenosylcobinamide kinase / adenosylcobinamide-phosphate guanylyltransferase
VIALVLGGARSGKSRYASTVAKALSASPVMLATSRTFDPDHAARIARHQAERGPEWTTIEEEKAIARTDLAGRIVVVDCATLWLTNFFLDALDANAHAHAQGDGAGALEAALEELGRVAQIPATWIVVSNELGMAPHAPTEMGRKFVDLQGLLNQGIAARAVAVTLMVAGIPLPVKGGEMVAALRSEAGR